MNPEIKIIELKEQPALTIRENISMPQIPEEIGKIYSEICAFMGRKGISPSGAPFSCWHEMNDESMARGVFDMEAGFPVSDAIEGEGRVKKSFLPAGRAVTAIHIGPYQTLAETYQILQSWIDEGGYSAKDYMWEVYLTDPCKEPDQSRWMTQIFWPIK
jgi:effector-binding domain-containing protein